MPRAEKGSAKAIANKVKSKGLQKLKWFCQMCNKQCRDQNGFKCHLTSESHQRQLLLFAENQNSYLREFSREFESSFMRILRHQFGSKRVRANEVYQEVIKDKGHVHMNSTVWHTLTGFVMYLGSSGKCKIDQGEKGWYIQYIDQEEELRRNKLIQRARKEKDEEERNNELLERQISRALEKEKEAGIMDEEPVQRELIRENEDEKIKISLAPPFFSRSSSLLLVHHNPLKMPSYRSRSPSPRRGRAGGRGSSRDRSVSPSTIKRLHLADLDETVTRRGVEEAFSKYGKLTDVWVASYPPYFGFVVFDRSDDANDALKAMRHGYIGDCHIRTTIALPRGSRRSPRPYRRDDRRDRGYGGGRDRGYGGDRDRGYGGGRDRYGGGDRRRSRTRSPPRKRDYSNSRSRSRSPVGNGNRRRASPIADDVSD